MGNYTASCLCISFGMLLYSNRTFSSLFHSPRIDDSQESSRPQTLASNWSHRTVVLLTNRSVIGSKEPPDWPDYFSVCQRASLLMKCNGYPSSQSPQSVSACMRGATCYTRALFLPNGVWPSPFVSCDWFPTMGVLYFHWTLVKSFVVALFSQNTLDDNSLTYNTNTNITYEKITYTYKTLRKHLTSCVYIQFLPVMSMHPCLNDINHVLIHLHQAV